MSDIVADRNLLFGILALQMDFITRDALIAADERLGPATSTEAAGPILVEQGRWHPGDRALLEPWSRRHIQSHGGDPAQSLAAAGSVERACGTP